MHIPRRTTVATLTFTLAASLGLPLALSSPLQAATNCSTVLAADAQLWADKQPDQSEVGIDNAMGEWASCLDGKTNLKLKSNPKLAARLKLLETEQWNFLTAVWDIAGAEAGGGTMFAHGLARMAPTVAEHRARLVALTTSKKGAASSATIVSRYDAAVKSVNARIKAYQSPSASQLEFTNKTEYLGYAKNVQDAWKKILPIAGPKKDAAGLEIVEFMASSLL
jgi:hypothetical protein